MKQTHVFYKALAHKSHSHKSHMFVVFPATQATRRPQIPPQTGLCLQMTQYNYL
jgi:hypothetical protein